MKFEVNNRRTMHIYQPVEYQDVRIDLLDSCGNLESDTSVSVPAGDFVMLVNYYRYCLHQGQNLFEGSNKGTNEKATDAQIIRCLITYPETDCPPDILLIPADGDVTKELILNYFCKTLHAQKNTDSRLEKLDKVISSLKGNLGVDVQLQSIDFKFELN